MKELRLILLCSTILGACKEDLPKSQFSLVVSDETGISFINSNKETEIDNIMTFEYFYNGGGVAVGDINNDGLPDLYFSSNQGENKLYMNLGNFKFADITEQAGVAASYGWKSGVTFADINNDGWLDIYVCRTKDASPERRKNLLFINNQNFTFTEKAAEYGLDDPSYSTQAAFFDVDRDGDLDAFLLNHSLITISNAYKISGKSINSIPYVSNRLLINNNGQYQDASQTYGIMPNPSNFGLGISVADINNDGWLDVYTSCDYTGNDKLYINNKGKTFIDATDSLLSHQSLFSMGLDIADVNNDGLLDILTLDMLPPDNARQKQLLVPDRYEVFQNMVQNGLHYQYMRNMLHINNGDGTFSEVGQLAGISSTDWSWSPLIADFDNDGLSDVFITNSFKRDFTNNDFIKYRANNQMKKRDKEPSTLFMQLIEKMPSHQFKNRIFKNETGLTFTEKTIDWGFNHVSTSTGAVYADLDLDGDLDIVVCNLEDDVALYRNNTSNHFNWLTLDLKRDNNLSSIGTYVTIYSEGRMFTRTLLPVRGFLSSVDCKLHFGLGNAKAIDSVVIRWPDNLWQKETQIPINKNHVIRQQNSNERAIAKVLPLFQPVSHNITYQHRENSFIDFKIQALLPRSYSTLGPALAIADVDNNGLVDYFLGGAAGQPGEIWLQKTENNFILSNMPVFLIDKECEDIDAIFFDSDNDGDMDLYVVSGGYEFNAKDKYLQDRLYLNLGSGKFIKKQDAIPTEAISGSCVRSADVDADGDLDLFVGGRIIPGQYPESAESRVLINEGNSTFKDKSEVWNPSFKNLGLITDAIWLDINHDKKPDLIVCGEWAGINVFINNGKTLHNRTSVYFKESLHGWWNCLAVADIDGDGDLDIAAGNHGVNNLFKPSEQQPVTLTYSDFDNNGSIDPILSYYIQGKVYPYATRDELADQMPVIKKKFNDYQSYSQATLPNILSQSQLSTAKVLSAITFQSTLFINQGTHFERIALPIEAQFAPTFSLAFTDLNNDGHQDLVTGGNLTATRIRTGRLTGNTGFVFMGNGNGSFKFLKTQEAQFSSKYTDVRKIIIHGNTIVTAANNEPIRIYKY